MKSRLPAVIVTSAAVLFLMAFSLPQVISLYVDWLWFKDIQYVKLFTVKINMQVISALAGFIAAFVITYVNLLTAMRLTRGRTIVTALYNEAVPQLNLMRHIDKLLYIVPLLVGLFTAVLFNSNWLSLLYYLNSVGFGYADPIFGKDISFYIFTLPVLEIVFSLAFLIFIISFIVAALNYFLKGSIVLSQRGIISERAASTHLSVIGSILFLVIACRVYTEMHAILYSSGGLIAGATYSDIHAVIPFMKIQLLAAVAAAAVIVVNVVVRRKILVISSIAVYFAISFIGSTLYPSVLQKFVVAPNELVKETPYIKYNVAATRKGFGIEDVDERNLSASTKLDIEDIKRNSITIKNIRLWDHRPLLDTFSQVQEIRTYYEFTTVGNDRYIIDGEYTQTMLSPRELSSESIPTRNWINETLTFTHGYGITLGPVNQITPEGLPLLLIKDIPPVTSAESIKVSRPEIYYGKLTNNHVIVNTKSKEFDYPSGDENVFTEYSGRTGVVIDSFFRKVVFATYFGSMKLLLSNDVTRKSRILFLRNITARIEKAMPFLVIDSDPYMVISDEGQLFWICDAYTASSKFPYSQPLRNRINYIRNSVKITINAFDGSMNFYIADKGDPLIQAINNIFPGVLKPLSDMPNDLRKHIRYPLDIFGIQTAVHSTYHMQDPQIFYNKEDQWEIPVMGAGTQRERMEPYYTIMKLPEEKREEFILMLPFNPKKKDNLSAWMVARSDGEYYGKLVVYRFPKDRLVYGPKQIVARINQDTEISRQISLWDQRGSQVIQGTLLVIPIESSLIYVQPLYLRAETGKIPELKRVIVAYENRIAMEESLDRALSAIFGDVRVTARERPMRPVQLPDVIEKENLAVSANEHYKRAMKAQREGNWALYGEEIRKLGEIIEQMRQ
jgi:uncharacterized membrane protein (UPF0182 family)